MVPSHLRLLCACAVAASLLAARPSAQGATTALPPPTADAQRLLDQWKLDQANIIDSSKPSGNVEIWKCGNLG
jgi:hypothetical protein